MKKFLCLFICLFLFAGCSGNENNTDFSDEGFSSSVTLSMRNPDTLHPLFTKQQTCTKIYDLIYDSLVYVDNELRPVSCLAEKCTITDDRKTIQFTLKDSVKWHDGKAFTAYDVEHTFNQIMYSEDSIYKKQLQGVSHIKVTDSSHINVYLTEPNVNILNLMDFPIIPAHINNLAEKPVGTGMYKFISITDQREMVLERNDEWQLGERPKPKQIKVRMLASDKDTASIIKLGEAVAATTSIENIGDFGTGDYTSAFSYLSLQYEFIGVNCKKDVLSSSLFRRALSCAIDRESIIEAAYFGYAKAANSPVPPSSWLYDSEYDICAFDTDAAKKYLLDAGFMDTDGDDFVEYVDEDDVQKVNLCILINDDSSFRAKSAESIVAYLKEIGVKAYFVALPFEEYSQRISEGDFDLFIGGYDLSADLDFRFMLHTDSIEAGTNFYGYSSSDMDKALSDISNATSDTEIKDTYRYFQGLFSRDVPVIGLCFKDNILIHSNKLMIGNDSASLKIYRNINEWSIKNE